ncbi:SHOCT domain-containing protein [Propionicicella superfundia]|uniref:SHOCT domain-containing protein n=1 Tax=Propionicicella superfundia TaxID=348582 RepID=UPI00048F129F|nr:SHOCT domain-containing protein [Propionicicella superfundia]
MSLLRTAARAHVAASVIGRTHRRQQQRWAAQDAATQAAARQPAAAPAPGQPPQGGPPVPPPPAGGPAPQPGLVDQLTQLAALRDSGVLSPVEFETAKQRILAGA